MKVSINISEALLDGHQPHLGTYTPELNLLLHNKCVYSVNISSDRIREERFACLLSSFYQHKLELG